MRTDKDLRSILKEANSVGYGYLPIPTEIDNKIIDWLKSHNSLYSANIDDALRNLISQDEVLLLLSFCERMATLVLRIGSQEHYTYGLRALALAHGSTYDERDVLVVLCLYIDLSLKFNLSPDDALELDAPFRKTITSFFNRKQEDKDIAAMGYVIQHEESGPRYKRTW